MTQNDLINANHSGMRRVRDNIIAMIIGFQNEQGNNQDSEEYKAYQRVLHAIEDKFGSFMSAQTDGIKRCDDCGDPCERKSKNCGCKPTHNR